MNERTHEYKKEESITQKEFCCCHQTTIYYDTTLNVKRVHRLQRRYQVEHYTHTYPKMFDWERTYFLCSLEFHWKMNVCLFYVCACTCVCAIHDVPKRPSYSLVNEEKLLFSLGLIILFKHPVVSLGSCTSTNSLHMLMLTTSASNLQ